MAIMEKRGSDLARASESYGMGLVRSTSFGRKRVFLSNQSMKFGEDDDCSSLKRRCSGDLSFSCDKSSFEDLPQEILIRILCGVEHDDLKRLFFVSKAIRQATLIAKQSHFAFNTPRKTVGFVKVDRFDDELIEEMEAPNAPKQSRVPRQRLSLKKLADISVALFAGGDDGCWPRGDLFSEN